jgi:hypothetical protein
VLVSRGGRRNIKRRKEGRKERKKERKKERERREEREEREEREREREAERQREERETHTQTERQREKSERDKEREERETERRERHREREERDTERENPCSPLVRSNTQAPAPTTKHCEHAVGEAVCHGGVSCFQLGLHRIRAARGGVAKKKVFFVTDEQDTERPVGPKTDTRRCRSLASGGSLHPSWAVATPRGTQPREGACVRGGLSSRAHPRPDEKKWSFRRLLDGERKTAFLHW